MTKSLLGAEWIHRLNQYSQCIVGFSGGLDSTVLLHVLAAQPDLKNKLLAVHIHHGISPNALAWQTHCQRFCQELGIAFVADSVDFDRSSNVEEHARQARYDVFASYLSNDKALLLGHHQDDQAETVLLQLFRGAGVDGLAAMNAESQLEKGVLLRPFLMHSRKELENYAEVYHLTWIEDESNQELNYSRNYLRQRIIPLLVEKWPGVVGNLARTATHCQQAKINLEELALLDCPQLLSANSILSLDALNNLPVERLQNVLRVWLRKNQIQSPSTVILERIVHEVIQAKDDAMPLVAWNEVQVRRYQQQLYLDRKELIQYPSGLYWPNFPNPLTMMMPYQLVARKTQQGLKIPSSSVLQIRFRQGGETFVWRGQTKKLKKLFQDWNIPTWLREQIPLLYVDDQLAAVIGYAVSDLFYSHDAAELWEIIVL
ncbi:MAG: tRNA lysidine(34) synthetase TilS [Legionella sp.]|nr:MAG: tRNA lysidine(34) synthetase TilS [Legionella sp.]